MERFLHFKHWQLFMLITGLPILLNIIFLVMGVSAAIDAGSPEKMFDVFKFFPIIMLPPVIGLFAWFWTMGIGLHRHLPAGVNMNIKTFRAFLIIPFLYMIALCIGIMFLFNGIESAVTANEPPFEMISTILNSMVIIVPLHLFSMFCIFYCIYFSAKTYKSVILGREALLSDYIGEFFLIWFNFVGVWIIQPKINDIANNSIGNNDLLDR